METIKGKNELWQWTKALIIAILIAFLIRTFLFTPVIVKGSSMEPTLHNKERMIVTKLGEPERFDIVVFQKSETEDYIKRVIGLPGDRVEYRDDILYINGIPYEEPYLDTFKEEVDGPLTGSFTLEETAVGSEVVPEGHLFVLGDNRQNSRDSRHIGAIPMDKVIGTTNIVYFPFKEIKIIGK
ncbi:signal peptidase I [Ornithinibacillus halotolerans]|uniref:Signal peptidase I n=1 Tax=Ornithinibacillus halotolerans TaxID=1274357 RepID=A0A916RS91_9BACI|nr:signal peptidase I [Ornithinibacillus halotolerans]GGA67759.1 signal peptidase I [Ornithinibacillus halotolerans]